MSRPPQLYQWAEQVATAFPHLSRPQATVLAWWSFGMALAHRASLSAVALQLAALVGQAFATVKQRLREWYCEASAKAGGQRVALDVSTCFAPLLHWVLRDWPGTQLAVALDPTSQGQRFVVLSLSILYRGSACPVAWKVVPATARQSWKRHWLALLRDFRGAVPEGWTVLVLADRGLYARWLFRAICRLGWHPLLRVTGRCTFRPEGGRRTRMTDLVRQPGTTWAGRGRAFKDRAKRLRCTLLARWEEGYEAPWLLLTDLPPEAAEACWYGLRAWIEHGFKQLKSDGWHWERTHMTDPTRAERLWLALAVGTWWCLVVGGEADAAVRVETVPPVPAASAAASAAAPARPVSVFLRGLALIVAGLLAGRVPWGTPHPEPWPTVLPVPVSHELAPPGTKT
jgi:Transposase DDE domain